MVFGKVTAFCMASVDEFLKIADVSKWRHLCKFCVCFKMADHVHGKFKFKLESLRKGFEHCPGQLFGQNIFFPFLYASNGIRNLQNQNCMNEFESQLLK